jgi:hypothetical protein
MFAWSEALGGKLKKEELEAQKKAAKKAKNGTEAKRLDTILKRRDSITTAISTAKNAAKSLNSKDKAKVDAALNNYGEAGIDNGVTVGIADEDSIQAQGGFTQVNKAGQIEIAFFESQLDDAEGTGLFAAVAHEGVHAGVAQAWLENGRAASFNQTLYQAEEAGYMVSSLVAQGNKSDLASPSGTSLWNNSWAKTDKLAMESRKAGINKHLENIGYFDGNKPTPLGSKLLLPGRNLKVK